MAEANPKTTTKNNQKGEKIMMLIYRGPKRLNSRKAIAKRKVEFYSDYIICACHNSPEHKGFYQAYENGDWKKEIQNPKFFVCNHCGALIPVPKGIAKQKNSVPVKIAKFVTVKQLQLADVKQGNGETGGIFSSDFSHIKK